MVPMRDGWERVICVRGGGGSSPPAGVSVGPGRRAKAAGFRISARQSLRSLPPPHSEAVRPLGTAERVPEEQPRLLGARTPTLLPRRRLVAGTEAWISSRAGAQGWTAAPSVANIEASHLEKQDCSQGIDAFLWEEAFLGFVLGARDMPRDMRWRRSLRNILCTLSHLGVWVSTMH